ncbi:unnamed protein product, partial [Prorocentrum cordatum]
HRRRTVRRPRGARRMARVAAVSHLWLAVAPPACGADGRPGGGAGVRLPAVGLGVAGNLDQDVPGTADAVERWLRLGGRAIDTALMYNNDAGVRLGIERSGVPRHAVVLTTKVPPESMGYASTLAALEQARAGLGVGVLDCALIHWPGRTWARRGSDPECVVDRGGSLGADWSRCRRESWAALLEAKRSGLVRAAGVANFELGHLRELGTAPDVLQVEFNPWWRRDDLLAWCRGAGAQLVAYASLGSSGAAGVLGDPLLRSIARRHGVTAAQVLLQWAVTRGIATIPSARSERHMRANLGCCDGWALSSEEDAALSSIPVADQYRAMFGTLGSSTPPWSRRRPRRPRRGPSHTGGSTSSAPWTRRASASGAPTRPAGAARCSATPAATPRSGRSAWRAAGAGSTTSSGAARPPGRGRPSPCPRSGPAAAARSGAATSWWWVQARGAAPLPPRWRHGASTCCWWTPGGGTRWS